MLKNATRGEPQIIGLIGLLNWGSIRAEEDLRFARMLLRFLVGDTIEVAARNFFHQGTVEEVISLSVRVVLGVKAVERFFAVYHRPEQTAALWILIGIEVC